MQRDGYQQSLWQTSMPGATNSTVAMPTDIQDVVVVGAGITGLSTALALRNAGRTCLVLEAKNIGFGTTGGTSAHINTILELSYDRMISKFGEEQAKLVARGALEAVGRIQHWAGLHAPTCHWLERDAYLFAQDASQAEELDKIVERLSLIHI